MNPYGVVSLENYGDVITVNGHSYADDKTDHTNFALLVSTDFTEPFDDPIAYGKTHRPPGQPARRGHHRAAPGRPAAGPPLHDASASQRGTVQPTLTGATPGDLSFVLPYRHLRDILDMLEAHGQAGAGRQRPRHAALRGRGEVLLGAARRSTRACRREIGDLYAVGDGAGITRGLVQASAAGVIAARSI